jgi:murein DD-endopeptidase MepM/ murein hydrolase activator NlpD
MTDERVQEGGARLGEEVYTMKRLLLFLIAASAAAPLAAPRAAAAAPLPLLGAQVPQRLALQEAQARLDLVLLPRGVLDGLVRWQCGLRDLAHGLSSRLTALAASAQVRIPDVSVLTTEPVENSQSSGFGWRDDPFRHRAKFHAGTDIRGKRGTPIMAAGDGVVKLARWYGGYGNYIQVDHGGGVVTAYAHLQRFLVKPDDVVVAGQPIGHMGATGRSTGSHLHFEVRLDGRPVDPVMAMTVARLRRQSPLAGSLASYALSPELQADRTSSHDPPRQAVPKQDVGKPGKPGKRGGRPDRPGRVKIVKPVS